MSNPGLQAHSVLIADPGPLVNLLPATGGHAWIRRGAGMIAHGEVARCNCGSIAEAQHWWRQLTARLPHRGAREVAGIPGAGPIAFGSFVFDPAHSAQQSALIVPELIVGRTADGDGWITTIGVDPPEPALPESSTIFGPGDVSWDEGEVAAPVWEQIVAEAVARIRHGELSKVVLARSLSATTPGVIDPRWLLRALTRDYARTWSFSVDGLIGASPEMLVRSQAGLVTSRALAGTIWRTPGNDGAAIAAALAGSSKDLAEHGYAVASVAQALAPYCSGMNVPDSPYVLELANVSHLATDVTAVPKPGITSLELAAALHPSAAVCGTPTDTARELIAEIEQLDRGRYAGPVGWLDSRGDGEWAIALRCGRLSADGHRLTALAGCGIVADSDPAKELAESNAKLVAIRDALTG